MVPQPLIDLGGGTAPDEQQFVRITGTFRRPDGSALVVESGALGQGDLGVRAFRPDGTLLWRAGRSGAGPGEFRGIAWSRLEGDTLLLYDASQKRITRFGPDGQLIRTESVIPPQETGALVGRFADGTYLLRAGSGPRPVPDSWQDSVKYFAWRPGSNTVMSLATVPGWDMVSDGRIAYTLTFGRFVTYLVDRDRLYYGDGGEPLVSAMTQDGRTLPAIRWTQGRVRVTAEDREAQAKLVAAERAGQAPRGREPGLSETYPETKYAEYFPAWSRLRIDAARNLWVERYPRPGEASTWLVFDSAGKQLAMVTLPVRFRLLEPGPDYVLGVWTDEDDVQHARMYRLVKPPR